MLRRAKFAAIPALALGLGGLAVLPGAARQDAAAQPGDVLQAAFHTGDCADPNAEPAFELAEIGPTLTAEGEPARQRDIVGNLTTPPILQGAGAADGALEDLLNDPYVLAVRDGDDILACGEVGGVLTAEQTLTMALRPFEDGNYAGVAALGVSQDGGTAGTVIVFAEADAFADDDDETAEARQRQPRATGGGGGGGGGGQTGGTTGGAAPPPTVATGGASVPVIAPPADTGGGDEAPPADTGGGGQVAPTEVPVAVATEVPGAEATAEPTVRVRRTRTPRDETPVATEEPPVETTEPTDPVETTEPTDPVETAEPTDPVETTEPTDPVETTEPTDPVETTEPTDPVETTEPTDPVETTEPTDPVETTEPTDPVETTEPVA